MHGRSLSLPACAVRRFPVRLPGNADGDLLLRRHTAGEPTFPHPTSEDLIAIDASRKAGGEYLYKVKVQIGARWAGYMERGRSRYAFGSTTVSFGITEKGKVQNVKVVKNTSNAEFAGMCRSVVEQLTFPPPNEDSIRLMRGGELPVTLHFNYLSPSPRPAGS
jgi:TonB family protein